MPVNILSYIRGLLQGYKVTCTYLERQLGFSHDVLTRTLREKFRWITYYRWVVHVLFGNLSNGWIILDDTVLAKPFGKKFPQASVIYSSCLETYVFGYNLVFVCWSDGTKTIPLCWRWYRKHEKTKIELAAELLKEVRTLWKIHPKNVLFDSWYGAEVIINQLEAYHWKFVCKVKKNRVINGSSISEELVHDGDEIVGLLTGYCQVRIIKNEDRYLATNDGDISQGDIIGWYAKRWAIEDVFRFLKDQLHLERCQARTKTAQKTHLMGCLVSYLMIVKENTIHPEKTLYRIKEDWLHNRAFSKNQFTKYSKLFTVA